MLGEIKDPRRTFPKAAMISYAIISALYLLFVFAIVSITFLLWTLLISSPFSLNGLEILLHLYTPARKHNANVLDLYSMESSTNQN